MTAKSLDDMEKKLIELKLEHRDLDDVINNLISQSGFDQIQLQRLKKRKLFLKDQILKIESNMTPNIIA